MRADIIAACNNLDFKTEAIYLKVQLVSRTTHRKKATKKGTGFMALRS
jgi:hypothetical protein